MTTIVKVVLLLVGLKLSDGMFICQNYVTLERFSIKNDYSLKKLLKFSLAQCAQDRMMMCAADQAEPRTQSYHQRRTLKHNGKNAF